MTNQSQTDTTPEETVERCWTISICPECGARQIWTYGVGMATPAPLHCSGGGDHPLRECRMVELVQRALLDEALEAIDSHRDTLDAAALHGPKRDRDQVDNDLYNLARRIRSHLSRRTET
jgi:hypothetical protein